uniref:Uncharacterized protein n=1 Tax=Timema poppense TaxID=170557 RepID=A0A7R9HEU4_TIMPO|nr:unnamed protein product [Timema poppensis]
MKRAVTFSDAMGLVDFCTSEDYFVIYLTEAELISGTSYRKKLEAFNEALTNQHNLSKTLRAKEEKLMEGVGVSLLGFVELIPGVGKKKARTLLETYRNLSQLLNAPKSSLIAAVGRQTADNIYDFLGKPRALQEINVLADNI